MTSYYPQTPQEESWLRDRDESAEKDRPTQSEATRAPASPQEPKDLTHCRSCGAGPLPPLGPIPPALGRVLAGPLCGACFHAVKEELAESHLPLTPEPASLSQPKAWLKELPRYYEDFGWRGAIRLMTDLENPERGTWVKFSDVETLLASLSPGAPAETPQEKKEEDLTRVAPLSARIDGQDLPQSSHGAK